LKLQTLRLTSFLLDVHFWSFSAIYIIYDEFLDLHHIILIFVLAIQY